MNGRKLVGANLRRLRVERNISQERLAFDAGVERSYVGGMKRGEENFTVDVLNKLAGTLAVSVAELFALPIIGHCGRPCLRANTLRRALLGNNQDRRTRALSGNVRYRGELLSSSSAGALG